jgi:hypothetical protein
MVYSGALTPQEMHAYVAVSHDRSFRSGYDWASSSAGDGVCRYRCLDGGKTDCNDDALLAFPAVSIRYCWSRKAGGAAGDGLPDALPISQGSGIGTFFTKMYLAAHVGPEQQDAKEWLKRRHWRACLRSLLPWLEKRRARVIETLRRALEQHLAPTGGQARQVRR